MFHLRPVGKYFLQICTTTPCWLRGSDEVMAACRRKLGIGPGEVTADGVFGITEVECVGACVNAPVIQVNDDNYEDLDGARTEALLDSLARNEIPPRGPTISRRNAAPVGGAITLTSLRFEGDGDAA
jgi:NADH:ubiquinone oxidoreductase subunit E